MIIGLDAKRAAQNATGLGNYSRYIIELLLKFSNEIRLRLFIPHPERASLLERLPDIPEKMEICGPRSFLSRLFPSLWRTFGIPYRLDETVLYHGLSNELPINIRRAYYTKSVVTIHDLLFLRYPEGYHWIDRQLYNFKYRRSCQNADLILAVSEFTKQDIIRYYHIPEQKIKVVYQGCDGSFRHPVTEEMKAEVRTTYDLNSPFILYVGSIERRKNLMLLAHALKDITPELNVIAVGRRTPYAQDIENYLSKKGLNSRMRLISDVPFQHLPALYQMAQLFVYPSRCEGFGIPILEALCSGVPVIACTGSCLEEAGGPASVYVHPDRPQQLASSVNQLWADPLRRQQMIKAGLSYAEKFQDATLYYDLISAYTSITSEYDSRPSLSE